MLNDYGPGSAGYLEYLTQAVAECDRELADPTGLTDEARAELEQQRDGYLALLEREERGHAID